MNGPHTSLRPRRRSKAFTVVEMVGVLAIIVVLGSAVTESVLTRVKHASRQAEDANLKAMGDACKAAVLRTRSLTPATNWANFVGAELAQAANTVLSNQSRITRAFLYDPTMSLGTGPSPVPYIQSVRGASVVINPRMLIVSSLTDPLPALNSAHFSNLWATATDTLPTGWSALAPNWTGDATDLKIGRIDLRPHFCRLYLNNLDASLAGRYAIASTNFTATVAAGGLTNGWYFVGTEVFLYQSDGTLQVTEILSEDASYVYEQGRWGRYLVNGKATTTGSFGALIDQFLAAPEPPNNVNMFGANKQSIVDEIYYHMWAYANWANAGFEVGGSSTTTQVPRYRFLNDATFRLNDFSANLLKK